MIDYVQALQNPGSAEAMTVVWWGLKCFHKATMLIIPTPLMNKCANRGPVLYCPVAQCTVLLVRTALSLTVLDCPRRCCMASCLCLLYRVTFTSQ
jgi:hypothetical protein